MNKKQLTHLSLFSGIGGLDIAGEMAGFETVGQCEIDDFPHSILTKHWPTVPKWRDIRTLTKESFYAKTGRSTVDIISGGFPCQPFSAAGKRGGREDDRFLWPEMLRVISEIKPTWFVGENVAGILSMAEPDGTISVESRTIERFEEVDVLETILTRQDRMLLESIFKDIERIGYDVQPFIIPACAVDAKHRRNRIAIVGHSQHDGRYANAKLSGDEKNGKNASEQEQTTFEPKRASKSGNAKSIQRSTSGEKRAEAMENTTCGRRKQSKYVCKLQGRTQPIGTSEALEYTNRTRRKKLNIHDVTKKSKFIDRRTDALDTNTNKIKRENAAQKSWGLRKIQKQPKRIRFTLPNTNNRSWPLWWDRKFQSIENPKKCRANNGGRTKEHEPREWWQSEPRVGRVADGIPNRVDRIKALGNAVVPQQFFPFFYYISEVERMLKNE